jgi:hypothetical protein
MDYPFYAALFFAGFLVGIAVSWYNKNVQEINDE